MRGFRCLADADAPPALAVPFPATVTAASGGLKSGLQLPREGVCVCERGVRERACEKGSDSAEATAVAAKEATETVVSVPAAATNDDSD